MSKQKDEAIYRNGWNDGFAKGAAAARFQLEAENAELREEYDWIYEFQSRMADRINGNPDVHNLVDYVNKLETKNAKLQEELEQWHKLTAGIELPEYPITQFQPKDLERENDKLRELVRELFDYVCDSEPSCFGCRYHDEDDECELKGRMEKLGVEV